MGALADILVARGGYNRADALNAENGPRAAELAREFFGSSGGGGNGGGGSVPAPFSFDYAAEAQKAYGELAAYYDRIITESKGDMNKALSRLVQDYETGIRYKREDTNANVDLATRAARNNALARGIYQSSAYGPDPSKGIYEQNVREAVAPIEQSFNRYQETQKTGLERQQTDLPEYQRRKEFDLEQERRKEAANMSNNRGAQAYQRYQSSLI